MMQIGSSVVIELADTAYDQGYDCRTAEPPISCGICHEARGNQ